jgi:small-conductance mechanosensitive channel
MAILEYTLLGNSLQAWLISVAVAVTIVFLLLLLKRIAVHRLGAIAARTSTQIDDLVVDLLRHGKAWFLLLLGLFAGALVLSLPEAAMGLIRSATVIALLVQAGIWAGLVINFYLQNYRRRRLQKDPGSVTTLGALALFGKIAVWAVVLLLALDNLGINVTALIAGLGVGGIAVALAVQNVLGDLLASLSIVLDKPFVVGDFIAVDDHLGSVEYVGLKTTRVRSLSGEQLVFSNSDLLKSRIRNYGRMFERRVVFAIGVTYETPRDKLEKIPAILRTAIEGQTDTRFDRAHFKAYGDFALQFEIVYYVLLADYNRYMDIQQAINFYILEQFEEQGIEFAYPTRTLWLKEAIKSGQYDSAALQSSPTY